MEEFRDKWRNETYDSNFIYQSDAEDLVILETYKRYKKKIDKIYKKIYKQIKKNPNKQYYYINANKYNKDEVIGIRNFFKRNDFKISNEKPEDKDAYIIYKPTNDIGYGITTACGSINTVTTRDIKVTTEEKLIIKPASFYICW